MTIEELGDVIQTDLIVRRYANQKNRWIASFENSETKESISDGCLTSTYGEGKSPGEAISNYVEELRNKIIVVGELRLGVPDTLTA